MGNKVVLSGGGKRKWDRRIQRAKGLGDGRIVHKLARKGSMRE